MNGMWGITGMSIGGKKSGQNRPFSVSFHANALFCWHIKSCMSACSSSHKKSPWFLSTLSRLSNVYLPVGVNGGGVGFRVRMPCNGSPLMWWWMRYCSGSSVITGLTLSATGFYFFFATTPFFVIAPWNVETIGSHDPFWTCVVVVVVQNVAFGYSLLSKSDVDK